MSWLAEKTGPNDTSNRDDSQLAVNPSPKFAAKLKGEAALLFHTLDNGCAVLPEDITEEATTPFFSSGYCPLQGSPTCTQP